MIFERNGFGNTLFCIVAGTVEFELADDRNPAAPPRLASSGEGDFFGEAGLVAGRRRAGTARAKTDCVLVELARRSAIKLLNSVPAARELFERTTIVRQLQRDLSSALTEADLERVLASAEIKQFPTGAKLIEEGAPDDRSVYLIRSGSVTVARRIDGKEVVLAYRPVGHIVGEMALLRKAPRGLREAGAGTTGVRAAADGHGRAWARLLPGSERRSGGAGFTWRPVPAMNRCVAGQQTLRVSRDRSEDGDQDEEGRRRVAAAWHRAEDPESARLAEIRDDIFGWRRWGPYVSDRSWGTVREDYSDDGDAWDYLPHDLARSKAYRWGEDGIAGICDRYQLLCFAPAFWNGRDPHPQGAPLRPDARARATTARTSRSTTSTSTTRRRTRT